MIFSMAFIYLHIFNNFYDPDEKKGLTKKGKTCILLLPFCNSFFTIVIFDSGIKR